VARNDRQLAVNVAVQDVEVGSAYAAGGHLNEQIRVLRLRDRNIDHPQGLASPM